VEANIGTWRYVLCTQTMSRRNTGTKYIIVVDGYGGAFVKDASGTSQRANWNDSNTYR